MVDRRVINYVRPATTRRPSKGEVSKLHRRRVLITTRSTCPSRIFLRPEFWTQSSTMKYLIFVVTQFSLKHGKG